MKKLGVVLSLLAVALSYSFIRAEITPLKLDGLLFSQVGYNQIGEKRVVLRDSIFTTLDKNAKFELFDLDGRCVSKSKIEYWGEKWREHWWIADFSKFEKEGRYIGRITSGTRQISTDTLTIARDLLWEQTWYDVAIEQLIQREELRRTNDKRYGAGHEEGGGWQDCGGYLREVNSHATMILGLCDMLDFRRDYFNQKDLAEIERQVMVGLDYIAFCQDKAEELGWAKGAVIHHWPKHTNVVTGDVAKSAMVFAIGSRVLKMSNPDRAKEYLSRSQLSFDWLDAVGPNHHCGGTDYEGVVQPDDGFDKIIHGASSDFVRPVEWMTRDLVMMSFAAVELYKCGQIEYKQKAKEYASAVMRRQISKDDAEGGLYGHFRTYDSCDFSEKAFTHHKMAYDTGSTFPHYILPFIEMARMWSDDPFAKELKQCIKNFAYGYLYPACIDNPFELLPMGYYKNEGLLVFSGLWHGINGTYGSIAALSLELVDYLKDYRFKSIAINNLQWIVGVNSGVKNDKGEFKPKSMIYGVGKEFDGSWTKVQGTICNGFDADAQFIYEKPMKATDGPNVFTDEGWITHSGGWLSAIARLK